MWRERERSGGGERIGKGLATATSEMSEKLSGLSTVSFLYDRSSPKGSLGFLPDAPSTPALDSWNHW